MRIEKETLSIEERIDLENAKAQKEQIETQNLLIQYLAEMSGIYIPTNDEGGTTNVSNVEEAEG